MKTSKPNLLENNISKCCLLKFLPRMLSFNFSYYLTFTTLWAFSADDKMMLFFLFSQKTGFDISCKLSP